MNTITTALATLDKSAKLLDLPERLLETGEAISEAIAAAGYWDGARETINQIDGWNMTVQELETFLVESL
jgi:hypothetical protein